MPTLKLKGLKLDVFYSGEAMLPREIRGAIAIGNFMGNGTVSEYKLSEVSFTG